MYKFYKNKSFILIVFTIMIGLLLFTSCQSLYDTNQTTNAGSLDPVVKSKLEDANYYLSMGNLVKARQILLELIELEETGKVSIPDYYSAEIYLTVGYLYEIETKLDFALKYYKKALKMYKGLNFIEETFQVSLFVARVYYYFLNYAQTLEYLNFSISLYESHLDKKNIYYVVTEISKIYFNTRGVDKAIDYLENIIEEDTFLYNPESNLNILSLLSVYYQRKGDIQKTRELNQDIENRLKDKDIRIVKTDLDYYIHQDAYKYINVGNYNLAMGMMMMMPMTNDSYFEILRLKRLTEQESVYNIPISYDYFDGFPYLYAGLFLIESGYLEAKDVNLKSGVKKITEAIDLFYRKGAKYHLAEAYYARARAYYINEKYTEATQDFLNCLDLYRILGLTFEYGLSVKYIGLSFYKNDNIGASITHLEGAINTFKKLRNHYELAPIYERLYTIYKDLSDKELSNSYLMKAIKSYSEIGDKKKVEELNKFIPD